MKVLFLPEVRDYLKEVSLAMYEKDYFGFLEFAEKYIDELIYDIVTTLPFRQKKPAPEYFSKYGENLLYSIFPKNKNTSWYVFFNIFDDNGKTIYLVSYISNNHVIAQFL